MENDRLSVLEDLLQSIVVLLLRRKILSREDLLGMAAGFERQGGGLADAESHAHCRELALLARCMVVEAEGRPLEEEVVAQRRGAFRIIEGGAGS